MIPVFRPSFGDEEADAVRACLQSGWVGRGPRAGEFERAFADFIGASDGVAVSSGTAALFLALRMAGVDGGEVVTTPLTFVATNQAILAAGGIPVFADIEPDTLNIDPADVERKITARTRALVVVHYAGHPCRMGEIVQLAQDRGVALIEDCAHAIGSMYEGRHVGTFGHSGCFSFQAIKNLSTGDGGLIAANRCDVERLRRLTWLGIDRDSWGRSRGGRGWEFDVTEVSLKYQLSDLAAAIGLVQLHKLERTNARRRALAERYDTAFADLDGVHPPARKPYALSSWHMYVIRLERREWRDALVDFLKDRDIASMVHYVPSHLFRVYAPYRVPLPVAEDVWERIVTLPLFPDMTELEQERVIDAVREFRRSL